MKNWKLNFKPIKQGYYKTKPEKQDLLMFLKTLINFIIAVNVIAAICITAFILYGYLQEKEIELTHKEENESRNKD